MMEGLLLVVGEIALWFGSGPFWMALAAAGCLIGAVVCAVLGLWGWTAGLAIFSPIFGWIAWQMDKTRPHVA